MRATLSAFSLAFSLAFLVALVSAPADARPPAPLAASLMLNGEARCDIAGDGGCTRLVSTTTAIANAVISCGGVYKVVCPTTAANLCTRSQDAGCNFNQADEEYGDPIAAGGFLYFVANDCPPNSTKYIYAVSPTGAGVSCPILRMR